MNRKSKKQLKFSRKKTSRKQMGGKVDKKSNKTRNNSVKPRSKKERKQADKEKKKKQKTINDNSLSYELTKVISPKGGLEFGGLINYPVDDMEHFIKFCKKNNLDPYSPEEDLYKDESPPDIKPIEIPNIGFFLDIYGLKELRYNLNVEEGEKGQGFYPKGKKNKIRGLNVPNYLKYWNTVNKNDIIGRKKTCIVKTKKKKAGKTFLSKMKNNVSSIPKKLSTAVKETAEAVERVTKEAQNKISEITSEDSEEKKDKNDEKYSEVKRKDKKTKKDAESSEKKTKTTVKKTERNNIKRYNTKEESEKDLIDELEEELPEEELPEEELPGEELPESLKELPEKIKEDKDKLNELKKISKACKKYTSENTDICDSKCNTKFKMCSGDLIYDKGVIKINGECIKDVNKYDNYFYKLTDDSDTGKRKKYELCSVDAQCENNMSCVEIPSECKLAEHRTMCL